MGGIRGGYGAPALSVSGRTEFFGAGNYGIGDKGVDRWRGKKYENGAEMVDGIESPEELW